MIPKWVFTMPKSPFTMAETTVHDDPKQPFTMDRNGCSRWSETSKMAQQVRKERADLGLADVVMVPLVVEAEVLTNGADRETGNHRDPIAAIPMAHERRLAARRPGAQHGGREHETGLVYKDDVGPQPNGVFFTRGQALRFQRVIACSSRSRARRSGFWQLQPH